MYCQKCRQPLRLDASLENLNPAAYDLLVSTSSPVLAGKKPTGSRPTKPQPQDVSRKAVYEKASQTSAQPTFKRHHGSGPRDNAMSFIYLTESQMGHPHPPAPEAPATPTKTRHQPSPSKHTNGSGGGGQPIGDKADEMDRINRLFEILSARSDIDYPICVDCTDMLVQGLQKKLDTATKERDVYVKSLRELHSSRPSAADVKAQQASLKKAEEDRDHALKELKKLEKDKDDLDAEIVALEEESRQLDREEEQFWRERNAFAAKMSDFQSDRDSINVKYSNDSELLQKLQRSNVYNDTFNISHDGSFATINGLRLGRLSSKPVDWPEINAAWGHALLLLVTVADKLGYKFRGYEAQPMGSTSKIIQFDAASPTSSRVGGRAQAHQGKKHVLELYSSGDMPLGLTFMHRKFDNAMVAFLELVRQLGVYVHDQTERSGNPLNLPYNVDGDKIGDVSIKLGIAQDDGWTKACKLTLTCCKFLLAHASNVSTIRRTSQS